MLTNHPLTLQKSLLLEEALLKEYKYAAIQHLEEKSRWLLKCCLCLLDGMEAPRST
jgi:hypothetical protein